MVKTMLDAIIEEEERDLKWELHKAREDCLGALARFARAKAKAREFEMPVEKIINESREILKKNPPPPHSSTCCYLFEDAHLRWK